MNIKIKDIETFTPDRIVSNTEIEDALNKNQGISIGSGIVKRLFGIESRRFAEESMQVSDMACHAARPILNRNNEKIDLLIFAAACSDLIEPATSNIVQYKLGLDCPCMDIKNACNSFLNAVHTASAFIQSGVYKNILIVNGEKLSDAINFNIKSKDHLQRSLAAYSLGDAGVAMLLGPSPDETGIQYQKFYSNGSYWDLCTIQGGGSMHPHDPDKLYFEGQTHLMEGSFVKEVAPFVAKCFKEKGWTPESIDHLVTHQVSLKTFGNICNLIGVDLVKNINVFSRLGNIAAASIPTALAEGIKHRFREGERIAVLGFAAGISASVQFIQW